MGKIYHEILIEEFKIKASIIQKTSETPLKRKHVLNNIAHELGFDSWKSLKDYCLNPFGNNIVGGFLNHWFADYHEAKQYLNSNDGYLLPYKNQYVIGSANFIEVMNLKPESPYWIQINYNFVYPEDRRAFIALFMETFNRGKNYD